MVRRPSRAADLTIVLAFIALITLPLAANLAGADGADPESENRQMATFPRLDGTLKSMAGFGNNLGRWFDDHFGFRSTLVRWYGKTRLLWLGVSPSSTVIKGRDGWLFYSDDSGLEDYVSAVPFADAALDDWRRTLVSTDEWLAAHGTAFVFTVAPDKHVIYPEQMPDSLRPTGQPSRTDQLLSRLQSTTQLSVGDVRPALMSARQHGRIYHLTDTHWNDRGAFVAYRELIEAVRTKVPAVPPAWQLEDFTLAEREVDGLDLAGMIGLTRVLRETDLTLVPRRPRLARVVEPPGADPGAEEGLLITEIPGSTLPRAVVVRDSFASRLVPFLSEHFSRVVYQWQNYVDIETVMREKPAVVIQEIVGRHLMSVAPYDDIPNDK